MKSSAGSEQKDTTNSDGVPGHSIEAMIEGGADQAIWNALLANVAAGIRTHGTEVGGATDSQGTVHVMKHTRPELIPIYVGITLTKEALDYPSNGNDQVKQAVVTWGNSQKSGKDAVATAIGARSFEVPGVLDATALISLSPTPTLAVTLPISLRQRATYDTSHVTITATNGVP